MHPDPSWTAQRAVVLQLLREDHPVCWSWPELEAEIDDLEQQAVANALAILDVEGVVVFDGQTVWASRCARHLDTLDLIAV